MDGPGGPTDSAPHQIVDRSCLPVQRGSCSRTPGVNRECQRFWYQMVSFEVCNDGVACSTAVEGAEEVLPDLVSVKLR
jgi:hypothetical protein